MASYYVRSGAGGAGTGADWANAYTTLVAAFSGKAAGDIFYVSDDHAETQASAMTLSAPGSPSGACFIYCVNHSGSVPPVSADLRTTATITTTGNSNLTLTSSSGSGASTYYYGITFNCGTGANNTNLNVGSNAACQFTLENCVLALVATGSSALIQFGATSSTLALRLINTPCSFAAVGQSIKLNSQNVRWENTASAIVGSVPTSLFVTSNSFAGHLSIVGIDLSAATSGKTLIGALQVANPTVLVASCKLGASVTKAATPSHPGTTVDFVRCDSGATNYIDERYAYEGTQTVETTIVRTGGASDGATPISWKLVATANSKWLFPFKAQTIYIWNESTSAITDLTFYGTTTGGGVPNNDDIWVEVEYLGNGSNPQGSFITSTKATNLTASAATNNSSDASTWGGSGAGNGFKIVVPPFTPAQAGPLNITVKVGKASATYYIDPKPSISGVTVSRSYAIAPGVYVNELQSGGASGGGPLVGGRLAA